MWTCQTCGTNNDANHLYCSGCGQRANSAPASNTMGYAPQPYNRSNTALIVILSVLAILLVGLASYVVSNVIITTLESKETGQETAEQQSELEVQPHITVKGNGNTQSGFDITPVNNIINNYSAQSKASVSVCDLSTGEVFSGNRSGVVYASTGFYIPIYLQAETLVSQGKLKDYEIVYPSSSVYYGGTGVLKKENAKVGMYDLSDYIDAMMLNMDNGAANTIIERIGGFSTINQNLKAMGYYNTTYNRQFGVSSINDNYTSASDASKILYDLYKKGGKGYLRASNSGYGISVPSSCTVYAHYGRIDSLLNAYVIIEASGKAYGVAVMTTGVNNASDLVSDILYEVRSQM